jgi:hypothetical protein
VEGAGSIGQTAGGKKFSFVRVSEAWSVLGAKVGAPIQKKFDASRCQQ